MATRPVLKATKRDVFGKKLNASRNQGKIPGNIYGKHVESTAVFIDEKELRTLLKDVNETTLIDLVVDGEKARPVILRDIVSNPVKALVINHVDIQQVNLKEKMQLAIPVKLIGENELAEKGEAVVETITNEIEIEALPTDLPEHYEIDISTLTEIGQHVLVKDLLKHAGVEVLTDPEAIVVSLAEPQKQEEEPAPVDEQAQVDAVETTEEGEKTEDTAAEENKE